MRQLNRVLILLSGLFTVAAAAENIGDVAGNITVPIVVARYFFSGGSYVLGAGFFIAAFFRYMRFRQNPQESPIGMVIVLLLIAIGLVVLPFSYQLSNYLAVEHGAGDVVST